MTKISNNGSRNNNGDYINNFIWREQYAIRTEHSTINQLTKLIDELTNSFNRY